MSTKIKDSLHELICSLTKTEKRYFKLYVTRHSGNDESNTIVLFDFIAKQEQYDEEAIFTYFKGKAFLNQFSTVKKRLYDYLLHSLHLFHANASLEAQLGQMLHQATILYEKSLYDQSLRQLRSIEKMALKNELSLVMLQTGKLKQRILETKGYHFEQQDVAEMNSTAEHFLSKEQLLNRLWKVKSELFQYLQSAGVATNITDKEKLQQLAGELPDHATMEQLRSAEAFYLLYHIQSAYWYAMNEPHQSLAFTEKTIAHLQENPSFTARRPNVLISVLTNACYLAESLGHPEKSTHFLQLLKTIGAQQDSHSEDMQIKLFSSISSIELSLLILKGDFQSSAPVMKTIAAGLMKYGVKIHPSRRAFFQLKCAVVHIGNEAYSAALKQINLILNDPQLDEKEELMVTAHLLNVLLHFELRNSDYLPYAVKSAQRHLKARKRLLEFETAYFQALLKTTRAHELDIPEIFAALSERLSQCTGSENAVAPSVHFDFMTWIESKATGRTLESVIKDKYRFLASA